MPSETAFRLTLVVVVLIAVSVVLPYRLKAASSGEPISHQEEGYLFTAILRGSGLLLWISTLAYLFTPLAVEWASMPIPTAMRWCGAIAGIACSALMYWTLSNLGKNLTDTVVTRSDAVLITQGPYRWVRHPFYGSAALLMASVTMLTANGLIGFSSLLVLSLLAIRTPKEEEMLLQRFGDQYRRYMETTGKFIPRLW